MRTVLKTAVRSVFRQKRRSLLLAGAIAFGMLMITLMNGFTEGMLTNVRDNLSHALGGHVFVSGQEITETGRVVSRIDFDDRLQTLLETNSAEIASITRRSQTFGTVVFGSRQSAQMLYGVDFQAEERLRTSVAVTAGSLEAVMEDDQAIALPDSLAQRLGVELGETVLIRLDTVTGQRNVGEFWVRAFIEDQAELGMSAAFGHRAYVNTLLNLPSDSYQSLNLFLHDLFAADKMADQFRDVLPLRPVGEDGDDQAAAFGFGPFGQQQAPEPWDGIRFTIATINDIMEPIEAVVLVLDRLSLGVFAVLLVIIVVGITNTFRMIVLERTKEIGTMRALGMQRPTVRRIFLAEAAFLGLFGGVVGLGLALGAMTVVSRLTVAEPGLQFFLAQGRFTFQLVPQVVLLHFAILTFVCLASAYWPARSAADLPPIKALGGHL